jgi:hypothetical protein
MITPGNIIVIVSDYYRTPIDRVLSTCRKSELVKTRQVSMNFMKLYIKGMTLEGIGKYFPGKRTYKDHATVLHACKTVNNLIDTDKAYKKDIAILDKKITELYNLNSLMEYTESESERFERVWSERENILISESKYLKAEIIALKNEVSKLQGRIYGLKLNKRKPRSKKIKTMPEVLPIHGDPYKEITPKNDREYSGYRQHSL